jgi:hypothetical protein
MARYGAALVRAARTGRLIVSDSGFRIAARHRFVADDVIAWLMAAAENDARALASAHGGTAVPCGSAIPIS